MVSCVVLFQSCVPVLPAAPAVVGIDGGARHDGGTRSSPGCGGTARSEHRGLRLRRMCPPARTWVLLPSRSRAGPCRCGGFSGGSSQARVRCRARPPSRHLWTDPCGRTFPAPSYQEASSWVTGPLALIPRLRLSAGRASHSLATASRAAHRCPMFPCRSIAEGRRGPASPRGIEGSVPPAGRSLRAIGHTRTAPPCRAPPSRAPGTQHGWDTTYPCVIWSCFAAWSAAPSGRSL